MDKHLIYEYSENLYKYCSKETCYEKVRAKWTSDNRFWGHCAVISLLIQDKFGGDIKRCELPEEGVSHFYNFIDGEDIDVTIGQYNYSPIKSKVKDVIRDDLLSNSSTAERYMLLKNRLENKK